MIVLKGVEATRKMKEEVKELLAEMNGRIPKAAIIRVGEKDDDKSYERGAMKRITGFGMEAESYVFPEDISEEDFKKEFMKINDDPAIDGILLLRPLPKHIDGHMPELLIHPEKDLDGISLINTAKVFGGEKGGYAPCTAKAVIEVLKAYDIPLEGKNVVVVGRSMVVGRPLSMLLLKENATVTICHTRTKNMKEITQKADIIVACAGKAELLDADFVGKDAVVIDVGIHVREDGSMCGDVKWDGLEEKAAAATPVPGGVGAVTTAVLAKHLCEAAKSSMK